MTDSIAGNRFAFTGREWIGEVGMYDYRHRVYSPAAGRFLQPDPIGFEGGDVNWYRYAGNRAVAVRDSAGLRANDPPASASSSCLYTGNSRSTITSREGKVTHSIGTVPTGTLLVEIVCECGYNCQGRDSDDCWQEQSRVNEKTPEAVAGEVLQLTRKASNADNDAWATFWKVVFKERNRKSANELYQEAYDTARTEYHAKVDRRVEECAALCRKLKGAQVK
jgi:RHS repeat-associated protein